MSDLATWFTDLVTPNLERTEQERAEKRREMLESKTAPLNADIRDEYMRCGASCYALIVDRDRWNANAGEYGAANEVLKLCRLADVGALLARETITDALLLAHRDRHLDPVNRRLIGYSVKLDDREHYLVLFDGARYNTAGTAMRGPFYKNLFGHAVLEIRRDTDSGEFSLPPFDNVSAQFSKTRPRSTEDPLVGRAVNSGVSTERIEPPRQAKQFTAHARDVAAKVAGKRDPWDELMPPVAVNRSPASPSSENAAIRELAQKLMCRPEPHEDRQ